MCFHSSAFTVGITKKGEISSTRTMPRPGKGSSISSASATPPTTVIAITLPSSSAVLPTALVKDGSVTKNSKLARPAKPLASGCIRL
jgi:hypothetical protein